jgi:hypothetical protein
MLLSRIGKAITTGIDKVKDSTRKLQVNKGGKKVDYEGGNEYKAFMYEEDVFIRRRLP